MRVDVGEAVPYPLWAELPSADRVMVGGHTVWTGPFHPPVVVAQPNRWGVVEGDFPAVECVVEADPAVTGCLPLPERIVGFVDRAHRPIEAPTNDASGRRLIDVAASISRALTQVKGLRVAASPFGRTIPLLSRREADEMIDECADRGVAGMRPLIGLAGGVALSVHPEHTSDDLAYVADTIRSVAAG